MDIAAPAKLNLYLKILAKRPDGYHDIETLFEKISLCDILHINNINGSTRIICADPSIPVDENSLLGRTIAGFRERSGIDQGLEIRLEKHIPVGAGMGGGSSDAAALLKGMNLLSGSPLDRQDMVDIARKLGADIPFFLYDASFAYGKGRGDDIFEEKDPGVDIRHIIVNPPFKVSTARVYSKVSRFGLTKNNGVDRMFSTFLREKDVENIAVNLHNDLQEITLEEFPVLTSVISELKDAGAKGVLMSGSGPTIFGIFGEKDIISAEKELKNIFPSEENWKIRTVSTYRACQ